MGTALIAASSLKLTDMVPVSCHAAEAPPSKIKIQPGETYSVEDLLYALLLGSANDAARALGEKVSGSEECFARFMTIRLRQLGATKTNFETASGLPAPGQYTTAHDLALIFYKALQNPTLVKIMSTRSYTLMDGKQVRNHNRFLFSTDYAIAGKTGWTRASQHTYVGLFQNGDKRIIISLLGSPNKWPDIRLLDRPGLFPNRRPHCRPAAPGGTPAQNRGRLCLGSASPASSRARYKCRSRGYRRESTLRRGVVNANIASSGCKTSRSGSVASRHKKKTKIKAKSSACSNIESGG